MTTYKEDLLAALDLAEIEAKRARRSPSGFPVGMVFEWSDGTSAGVWVEHSSPMYALEQKFEGSIARDILVLFFFARLAGAGHGQLFWWWPDEHCATLGLASNKDNRNHVRELMRRLNNTRLTAHYRTGNPLIGPIVTIGDSDGDAMQIKLHTAFRAHLSWSLMGCQLPQRLEGDHDQT